MRELGRIFKAASDRPSVANLARLVRALYKYGLDVRAEDVERLLIAAAQKAPGWEGYVRDRLETMWQRI